MPQLDNERHEAFARRYAQHFTATKAARQVGFAPEYGAAVLAKPGVAERVRELRESMLKAADITAARVLLELGRVAFADIRQVFDENGHLIPIHLLDDDAAASIAGIEHDSKYETVTTEEVDLVTGEMIKVKKIVEVRTAKIKRFNKDAALGNLAKHFKLVGDEGDGVNALASALADRLKTARKRVALQPENNDEGK